MPITMSYDHAVFIYLITYAPLGLSRFLMAIGLLGCGCIARPSPSQPHRRPTAGRNTTAGARWLRMDMGPPIVETRGTTLRAASLPEMAYQY